MNNELDAPPRLKVIMIGDAGVGKTTILARKTSGKFEFQKEPTVGSSHILVSQTYDNIRYELCVWDTAGQEQYHSLVPIYVKDANVSIIVASITDHLSIKNLVRWKNTVLETEPNSIIIGVINKIDLCDEPSKPLENAANHLSEQFETILYTSARTGLGIEELFNDIVRLYSQKEIPISNPKTLQAAEDNRNKCC